MSAHVGQRYRGGDIPHRLRHVCRGSPRERIPLPHGGGTGGTESHRHGALRRDTSPHVHRHHSYVLLCTACTWFGDILCDIPCLPCYNSNEDRQRGKSDGSNYAWDGTAWDKLGGDIDLSGYQEKIDNSHKLSADLVDDTSTTHKFTSTSEKSTWNAKYDKPSGGIPSTDMSSSVQTSLEKAETAIQDVSGKEDKSNKTGILDENSTDTQYPHAKAVYDNFVTRDEEIEKLQTENAQLLADHPDILDENNEFPSGTDLTLNGTGDLKMKVDVGGNSTQETTSTSEEDEYDSPSPEHKQDINNVEGNVVVKGSNKNRLSYTETFEKNTQGIIYKSKNGKYSLNGTSNSAGFLPIYSIKPYTIRENDILHIGNNQINSNVAIVLRFEDDTYLDYSFSSVNRIINIPERYLGKTIVGIHFYINGANITFNNLIIEPMILKGVSTVTDFIEYAENTVTFPLAQGQKLMLGDTLEDDGVYHKRAKVTANELKTVTTYINPLTDFVRISFMISDLTNKVANEIPSGLCNYLKFLYDYTNESNHFYARGNVIYVFLEKTLLSSLNVTGVRAFLDEHPDLEIEYKLATETITPYTSAQQTAYNKLKEMQSYYDLTYVTGSSDNAQPILTAHAKKSLKVMNDEISNLINRVTILED